MASRRDKVLDFEARMAKSMICRVVDGDDGTVHRVFPSYKANKIANAKRRYVGERKYRTGLEHANELMCCSDSVGDDHGWRWGLYTEVNCDHCK